MEDILNVVVKDIQKHYYDASLKGMDWNLVTERARARIREADHLGDMIAAIASVPFQLNDSHTYFIPPGRSARISYGFEAEPFATDILVYKLKKDGPAVKAGLQLGDRIVGVNGFAAKRDNFFEVMRYFEFLNPQSVMNLQITRGSGPPHTVVIPADINQRGKGFLTDYNAIRQMIDAQESIYTHRDYEGRIGYIKLRAFMLDPRDVESMMHNVKKSSAVILDLRGNGGGALETLASLAGCFTVESYDLAKEIGRNKIQAVQVKPAPPAINAPLFVMVDDASASASEMFARTVQLRCKAVVIGDHSGGRVNAAQIFWEKIGAYDMVAFGTEITTYRVVLGNGEELENHGVTPDEFSIPTAEDLRQEKDPCLDRTIELARKATQSSQESSRN
jgi:carboxyl-terminal processing protease